MAPAETPTPSAPPPSLEPAPAGTEEESALPGEDVVTEEDGVNPASPFPAEGAIYQGPMVDAHSHLNARIQPELLLTAIRESGLEKTVLFVTPSLLGKSSVLDDDRVVPFFHVGIALIAEEAAADKEIVRNIEQALESGKAKGIGELVMRHKRWPESLADDSNPADHPLILEIYDLAAKHGVPVTIHLRHEYSEELERALAYNREARIIWAHYGDSSPQLVRVMMARHPNLYADLSAINPIPGFRHPELAPADPEGNIKSDWRALFSDWRALFLDFPDRFVFGIDMGAREARYRNAPKVVEYYRKVLGQLPAPVAKRIAHDNILVLLGH